MSRQLLNNLNGNKTGQLKKFLDDLKGEPRIAWYPSSGEDFRALLYLHPLFSTYQPITQSEPKAPDIFLFTDYYPWTYSTFLDNKLIYCDLRTSVNIEHIEELPILNLPLHNELIVFPEGSIVTDRAFFMQISIDSYQLGQIKFPVIYAFAENEAFYCHKLVPFKSLISHIIHIRYGGGLGGGGKASGAWLINVLKQLNCELFITDGQHHWQDGDNFALDICSSIPRDVDVKFTPIRVIHGRGWSDNGDVIWNLIS
jgi:hypothetical protein